MLGTQVFYELPVGSKAVRPATVVNVNDDKSLTLAVFTDRDGVDLTGLYRATNVSPDYVGKDEKSARTNAEQWREAEKKRIAKAAVDSRKEAQQAAEAVTKAEAEARKKREEAQRKADEAAKAEADASSVDLDDAKAQADAKAKAAAEAEAKAKDAGVDPDDAKADKDSKTNDTPSDQPVKATSKSDSRKSA